MALYMIKVSRTWMIAVEAAGDIAAGSEALNELDKIDHVGNPRLLYEDDEVISKQLITKNEPTPI